MVESKQHAKALSNLQNKIGDKDVCNFLVHELFRFLIKKLRKILSMKMSKALLILDQLLKIRLQQVSIYIPR